MGLLYNKCSSRSGVSRETRTKSRHRRWGATWCYIGCSVRDILKQTCNTSPPQGVAGLSEFVRMLAQICSSSLCHAVACHDMPMVSYYVTSCRVVSPLYKLISPCFALFIGILLIRLTKYIQTYNEGAPKQGGTKNPYEECSCTIPPCSPPGASRGPSRSTAPSAALTDEIGTPDPN